MSVTSGFFNSLNGDRRYTAEQFSEMMDGLINDGVFASIGTSFAVNASSDNTITVGVGRAWFNGTWLYNDAILPMSLRESEILVNRIDAVVIEINRSESVRAGTIKFVHGEPSNVAQKPSLVHTEEINQYPLAYIYRPAGATTVLQAEIENMVGTSECPFVTGILEVTDADQFLAQWDAQYKNWFGSLDVMLEGDVAANLAGEILELQSNFETLAREQAVYSVVQDANGYHIQDSEGVNLKGRTVLGGGNVIINPNGNGISYKIGDTLTTARTDLGDDWLLCNGETADKLVYPALYTVLPFNALTAELERASMEEILDICYHYSFVNGVYFMVGRYHSAEEGYSLRVCWSTDPSSGIWKYCNLSTRPTGNYMTEKYTTEVVYANGYYALSSYNDDLKRVVYYTNDLDVETWSQSSEISFDIQSFTVVNEKFVGARFVLDNSVSTTYRTLKVYYGTLPYSYTLSSTPTSVLESASVFGIRYGNGYYACLTEQFLAYSEDLSEWTIISNRLTKFSKFYFFDYADGYFFYCWCNSYSASSDFRLYFYRYNTNGFVYTGEEYSKNNNTGYRYMDYLGLDADGTPVFVLAYNAQTDIDKPAVLQIGFDSTQRKSLIAETGASDCNYFRVYSMNYLNGMYLITGTSDADPYSYESASVSNSITGPWTRSANASLYGKKLRIGLNNSLYEIDNSDFLFQDTNKIFLPEISLSDKTYTYIKAKE